MTKVGLSTVQDLSVTVSTEELEDYISITDFLKKKGLVYVGWYCYQ